MKMLISSSVLLVGLCLLAGCSNTPKSVTTPSGLVYTVVQEGTGPVAVAGQHVVIHETTTFTDGTVLFSSHTSGQPVRFLLGSKMVIKGVDEGVTGMKAGERRTMIVPPKLSQRSYYPEGLSPDDTLFYEVELVEIESQ